MTGCPKHRRYWAHKRLVPDSRPPHVWVIVCPCDIIIGTEVDGVRRWMRP